MPIISPLKSYKTPLLAALMLVGSCSALGNAQNSTLERSPKQDIVCISNTNNKDISTTDIMHYEKIIDAISTTIELMYKIDEVIEI